MTMRSKKAQPRGLKGKDIKIMLDSVRNLLMAGLGAALITRDKVLEATKKWVDKGSISTAEAEKLADEIMEESKRQARNLGQTIEEAVRGVLKSLELAKARDLEALEERVKALEILAGIEAPQEAGPQDEEPATAQPGPSADQMPGGGQ
jgi:polyhydroxyalkanoate synthesis regulator phasin